MQSLVVLTLMMFAPASEPAQTSDTNMSAPVVVPANQLSLSGRWKFNPDQSEDARAKMREAMGRSGGERGWGGPGSRSGGGYGGRGGREGGGGRGTQDGARRSPFQAPEELTISQTDAQISVIPKDGAPQTLHADGKTYKNDTEASEVKATWNETRLVVETKRERGPKTTETYSLSPDRKQLVIQVHFEGRTDVTVKRVYDAEAPE